MKMRTSSSRTRVYTFHVHNFGPATALKILLLSLLACLPLAAQIRVFNDGFPGENTAELQARLDGALHAYRPQIVVVFAGGNDALNDKKLQPPAAVADHLNAMVSMIRKYGAQPVLVQVHTPDMVRLMSRHKPEAYGKLQPLQRLALVNGAIAHIAKQDHAALVPFARVLQKAGGANKTLSTDGVHLTAKGYGLLAQAVREQLPSHLPADTSILCFGDSLTYGIGVRPSGDAPETPETYPSQLRTLLEQH